MSYKEPTHKEVEAFKQDLVAVCKKHGFYLEYYESELFGKESVVKYLSKKYPDGDLYLITGAYYHA